MTKQIKEIAPGEVLYSNTYVAVLDILGFKEIVEKNSTQELIELYGFFKKVTQSITSKKYRNNENTDVLFFNLINNLIVSDTIIIWTTYNSVMSFHSILETVSKFLKTSFLIGLPCRGCITSGDLFVSNKQIFSLNESVESIVVGKGMVEAYLIEKQFNWSGCVITESAYDTYKKRKHTEDSFWTKQIESFIVHDYPAPTKSGVQNISTVNWMGKKPGFEMQYEDFEEYFLKHKKTLEHKGAREKVENTWKYFNHCLVI